VAQAPDDEVSVPEPEGVGGRFLGSPGAAVRHAADEVPGRLVADEERDAIDVELARDLGGDLLVEVHDVRRRAHAAAQVEEEAAVFTLLQRELQGSPVREATQRNALRRSEHCGRGRYKEESAGAGVRICEQAGKEY
jgi:hypothetical protein